MQEITSWTVNTLDTSDDIVANGLLVGVTYQIREASTFSDVFGVNNTFGLTATANFDPNEADLIFVPDIWARLGGANAARVNVSTVIRHNLNMLSSSIR